MQREVNVGIIGGGLMGRAVASVAARWCDLSGAVAKPVIRGVASRPEESCRWFVENVATLVYATTDYRELLAKPDIEVIYCAVPHHLHQQFYQDIICAGKHLLGEKPFGIDRQANWAILGTLAAHPEVIARCVSQFPFYPGAQRIARAIAEKRFGQIIEVEAGFLHSSDLDPEKPINWKRIVEFNGEYGCMGDLGMHVLHVPLRAGWYPRSVRAILSNLRPRRKDCTGALVPCDTWDNATLLCDVETASGRFPMTLKFQRIAPGEMNTWYLNVIGERESMKFSLKQPRTLHRFAYRPDEPQAWVQEDLGCSSVYPTIIGSIFEFGFSDAIQQMLAAFLDRVTKGEQGPAAADVPFECATPQETRLHHELLTAALVSHANCAVVNLPPAGGNGN